MKRSSKLLLLKNQRVQPFARSWLVDGDGLYARTVSDAAQLGTMLRAEQFDIVLIDQRDSDDDLIETIEGIRHHQTQAKLIVVSDRIALQQVVQAMRFNVRDVFQPPFNPAAVAMRIESDFSERAGTRARGEREAVVRWAEVLTSLEAAGPGCVPVVLSQPEARATGGLDAPDREVVALRQRLDQALATQVELSAEVERLRAERKTSGRGTDPRVKQLQEQLAEAKSLHAEMAKEAARLGAVEVKLQKTETQLVSLRAEHAAAEAARREVESGVARLTREAAEARKDADRAEKAREKAEAKLARELERLTSAEKAIEAEREELAGREATAAEQIASATRREREVAGLLEKERAALARAEESLEARQEAVRQQAAALEAQIESLAGTGSAIDVQAAAVAREASELAARLQEFERQRAAVRGGPGRGKTASRRG